MRNQTASIDGASAAGSFPCAASSVTLSSRVIGSPPSGLSWNYRKQDDGGIILDMFCHWRYVLDHSRRVRSVQCLGATAVPERWDEHGARYEATADDTAYGTSWSSMAASSRRLIPLCLSASIATSCSFYRSTASGTLGSAVAGLGECRGRGTASIGRARGQNPTSPTHLSFVEHVHIVPDNQIFDNGFKGQGEFCFATIAGEGPFRTILSKGHRGVQLAELDGKSWQDARSIDLPEL